MTNSIDELRDLSFSFLKDVWALPKTIRREHKLLEEGSIIMIVSKPHLLKYVLGLTLGLLPFGCSSSDTQEEPMEVTDEQSVGAEGSQEQSAPEEGSLGDDSSQLDSPSTEGDDYQAVAYDETAPAPVSDSELDRSLDEVLDDTLETTTTDTSSDVIENTYAAAPEEDTGSSLPSLDEAMSTPVSTSTTTSPSEPVAQKAASKKSSPSAPARSPLVQSSDRGDGIVYMVQPGETLGSISHKVFGNSGRWQDIASLSGLANPNVIFPGDELMLPKDAQSESFASQVQAEPKIQIVVQEGDTLAKIAQKHFGNSAGWMVIWKQNQDQIKNPDTIFAGQNLAFHTFGAQTVAH